MYQVCPVSIVFFSLPHTFGRYHLFLTVLPLAVCQWKIELNSKLLDTYYSVQMKSAFGNKTSTLMKIRFIWHFSCQESHKKGLFIIIINKVNFCCPCSKKKIGSLFLDDYVPYSLNVI